VIIGLMCPENSKTLYDPHRDHKGRVPKKEGSGMGLDGWTGGGIISEIK